MVHKQCTSEDCDLNGLLKHGITSVAFGGWFEGSHLKIAQKHDAYSAFLQNLNFSITT